ncbi:MAG: hypothetical protein HY796_00475 [Elusimicrobia bacterium]|nr:hypothetical protein [Elusimicrobiota bacterium]
MGLKKLLPFPLALCLAACGAGYHYEEASKLEKQGLLLKAAAYYKIFADKNPRDAKAPGAMFKAAEIYSKNLGLCHKSKPLFEKLLKNYPDTPLRDAAMKGLFVCPDYFPIDKRLAWTYGDSETGGVNASQEMRVLKLKTGEAVTGTTLYAGRTVVSKQTRTYRLLKNELVETQDGFDTIILSYPVERDRSWTSVSAGRNVAFTVQAAGLRIKVRAGEFDNCVKVKQQMEGLPSWIYEYYAPWIGKILTSVAGKDYENRVMELLKYEETQKN